MTYEEYQKQLHELTWGSEGKIGYLPLLHGFGDSCGILDKDEYYKIIKLIQEIDQKIGEQDTGLQKLVRELLVFESENAWNLSALINEDNYEEISSLYDDSIVDFVNF